MATFAARISDVEYVNWLKVGLALNYLKEGLDDFVETESKAFHNNILKSLFGNTTQPSVCQTCETRDIKEDRKKKTWKVGCPYHVCDQILEKIVDQHVTQRNIPWFNCPDITTWPVDHWSVSKVYMTPGQVTSKGPADCDCSNFLNLFLNCKWYYSRLVPIRADEVRAHRNDLMHSTTMKISSATMCTWLTDMIKLLQSLSDFNNRPEAKAAVDSIAKTRDTNIEITTSDEIRVLKQIQQGLQKTVTEQWDEMRLLKKSMKEMETSVDTFKSTQEEMEKTSKEHGEDVKQLTRKLYNMEHEDFEVGKKMKNQEDHLEQIEGMVQELKGNEDSMQKRMQDQDDEMNQLKQDVETVEGEMKRHSKEQSEGLKQLKENMEVLEGEVNRHSKEQSEGLKQIEENMEVLGGKMEKSSIEHSEELKKLKEKIDILQANEEKLKRELQEKLDCIKIIEQRLETLQSPEKRHQEKSRELKQKLIEIYRQNCMEIPVSPLHTKKTVQIQKLYTDLVLLEQEKTDSRDKKEEKSEQTKEILVKSYEDMLYKKGKRMKNVFVLGEAGTGKSTLAKKMAADWVYAHTKNDEERTPNVKTMECFDFLFYVPLRAVPDCTSVFNAVCQNMSKYSGFVETIKHLFENQSDNILVICDGLDEIKPVLDQQNLHDCTTVTTTRPWKFDFVDQTLHHVDSVLELRGLNEKGIRYVIDKVLTAVYQDESHRTKDSLKQALGLNHVYWFSPDKSSHERQLSVLCKTPLLLVYLIHLWFEDGRSLPTSLTDIVTGILILTLRCGEKRLSCMEEIPECKKLWREGDGYEGIFKKSKLLLSYWGLLKCISSFALKTLTSPSRDHSLVFTDEEIEEYFYLHKPRSIDPSVQLEACVRLGLLTRTEYPSFMGDKYTLSFQHKAVHEYFAALGIVQAVDGVAKFVRYCKSVPVLLEMSSVFRFVCGLSPETGSEVSEGLLKMYDTDPDILQWRSTNKMEGLIRWWPSAHGNVCRKLTSLYLDCRTECKDKCNSEVLHIADCVPDSVFSYSYPFIALVESNAAELASLALSYTALQSLRLLGDESLSKMQKLVKLCLCGDILAAADALNVVFAAAQQLQILQMEVQGDYNAGKIKDVHLYLSSLLHLRHLRLWSSTEGVLYRLQQKRLDIPIHLHRLQTVLKSGHLETLFLTSVSMEEPSLDFTPLVHVSQLRLENIYMTWSAWCGLLSSLRSCHSLKKLYIQNIRPYREDTCTSDTKMDLIGCTQLQEVHIYRVNVGNIQLDFSQLVQLSRLRLGDIDMTWSVWCGLLSSLGSCHSLETLDVEDIRPDREDTCTSDTRMDLSGCTQLQKVDIERVNIGDIQLDFSPLVQLSRLRLGDIDMTWSVWCGLLSSLGSCHSLKTLYIEGIRPDREDTCTPDTRMDLSGCTQLQEVHIYRVNIGNIQLDFSQLVQLSRLRLGDIDMTWSVWCGLLSSLGSCHSLKTLYIEGIRPDREDTCTSDTRMDLSGCTQLQKVDIERVNIGDIQLDFSPLVQLSELRLKGIDMTWSVWCGLLSSLGSCHSLETLYIEGIRPDREDTYTADTRMDLSGCTQLQSVVIERVNIGDIQLDFSPLVQMSKLILWSIDMTRSVWWGLLSSLGSCHSLVTLYIWNIRPDREDTYTSDTRMDLSGCTHLQRVVIETVNIGEIQLDFSPLVQLSGLTLKFIDMTWSVWCGLLSSLGSCHSLETLYIEDMRPDREDTYTSDTRMDLSGCTQLQSVVIERVNIGDIQLDFSPLVQLSGLTLGFIDMTWSVWCGLLSSLGSCHSLKTLYIWDIRPNREDTYTSDTRMDLSGCTQLQSVVIERVNIGDIQLDFSPLVQLSGLTLGSIDMTWSVWWGLLSSLGSCHSLKTLDVEDIRPDREDTCTSDTRMDLSGCTKLQKVDIERVNIGDIQLDFSPLVQLSEVRLMYIDMTWSVWCGLLSSLGSCHSLKTLYIEGIRFDREDTCTPDTRMDLSGCTQLQEVDIVRVNIGDTQLDFSPLVQLSGLTLGSIDMTWSVWCGLLSSLGSCHSLKTLYIWDIRPDREDTYTSDTRMDLSGCTQLQSVVIERVNIGDIQLDFSPLVQVSELRLYNIDMTWSVWCGLLSSLGSCHSLKILSIVGIRPHREDTCTSDTRMDLSGCTQLQEVDIVIVNIGDTQLDFSPLVQLSGLTLGSIDMTWSVWCGLLSSLGSCHSLKTLYIWDIRPDREDTYTSDTRMDLSGCTQLQSVVIERVNIGDIQLDFSPLVQLSGLTLGSIDMTWSVWWGLLSSLGSCHSLKTLSIGNIRPGREDRRSDTKVELSGCIQLQVVCLEHTKSSSVSGTGIGLDVPSSTNYLSPVLSSLSQVTCLKDLTLAYLDSDCVNILLTVLPHLCNLTELDLNNINFGDHQLSFRQNYKLQRLSLNSVLFKSVVSDFTRNGKETSCLENTNTMCEKSRLHPSNHYDKVIARTDLEPTITSEISNHGEENKPGTSQLISYAPDMRQSTPFVKNRQQLKLFSEMGVEELLLEKLTLSLETWQHLFSEISSMQNLQTLNLIEVNSTEDLVKVPPHMYVVIKNVNKDSTIEVFGANREWR